MSRKSILVVVALVCFVIALANVRFHEEIEVIPRETPKDLEENFFGVTDEEFEEADAALKALPDTLLLSELRSGQDEQTEHPEVAEPKKPNNGEAVTPGNPAD